MLDSLNHRAQMSGLPTIGGICLDLSDLVDIKIFVDDSSKDQTALLSPKLGVTTFVHDVSYGYNRNQQTCYREALLVS